ncbi:MAG: hypothetical protein ACKVT0_01390 [Planctomycetaceae bacterium]
MPHDAENIPPEELQKVIIMGDSKSLTADTYFAEAVTSIFDRFFREQDARREAFVCRNMVRYSTTNWFAEVLYLPFDGPKYSPRVEIGPVPEIFDDPRRNRVDVMHTAPSDTEEHEYNLRWCFQSHHELEAALIAVRDRILTIYTVAYLQDSELLKRLLIYRRDVVEATWTNEINEHNDSIIRAEAEKAFFDKDYVRAIQKYYLIPHERRTQIDEKKLLIAKSRVARPRVET